MNAHIRTIVVADLVLFGSVSAAHAQPVQWRTEDGGNGHWYQLVVKSSPVTWHQARDEADGLGGHLATVTSATENTWVFANVANNLAGWIFLGSAYGPWLGGYQDGSSSTYAEPAGGWTWVTGEPWIFTAWSPGQPNDAGSASYLHFYSSSPSQPGSAWDDQQDQPTDELRAYVVEWDADCNGDGIVDKGQILSGQLADANGNGVPDSCEMPAAAAVWTLRAVSGPIARASHAMAYDSARGVTVLFGGNSGNTYLGDTWEWNGAAWNQRAVVGPSTRNGQSMAYDAVRGVTVLFGGSDSGTYSGETWEWNGTAWTQRNVAGPSPRASYAMAYDGARQVTVLFGGSQTGFLGDTWEWDGTGWVQRLVAGPSGRNQDGMAYDTARGAAVLFGGWATSDVNGETWAWNGSAWTQRLIAGPLPRYQHSMSYDAGRAVTVLFGGSTISGSNGETWEWNGSIWIQRIGSGPTPRANQVMTYDSARGVTVLFGGIDSNGYNGETWELGVPCVAPSITSQPAAQTVCPGGAGSFTVAATGTNPTYQWQIEAAPDNWVTLTGNPQPLIFCGPSTPGMAFASQPSSAATSISVLGCHGVQHWSIRAVISNACGSVNSDAAVLLICPADYNCNGVIEVADIFAFLNAWFAGLPNADFDGVNGLQVSDIFVFLNAWFFGC